MKFLFFFVHPSKYHLFRETINTLMEKNHDVDVIITKKEMLEYLVRKEKWNYINIFPKGRKIRSVSPIISASINFFRTLYRLLKFIDKKKYDLFITDDLLTIVGKIKKVPSILFQDDDLKAVPESAILLKTANYVLSPKATKIGKYEKKKLGFNGFKASAYLHPNVFQPNRDKIKVFNPSADNYFLIRLVSLRATHDIGKNGISNNELDALINILSANGKIFISSERALPQKYNPYLIRLKHEDIFHAIAFADLFISDSQTMTSEAGYLGVPFIRYNDFINKISYLDELENRYKLGYGIKTGEERTLYQKVQELLYDKSKKGEWVKKRNKMLSETIDLSSFMIWLLANFPESINTFHEDADIPQEFE